MNPNKKTTFYDFPKEKTSKKESLFSSRIFLLSNIIDSVTWVNSLTFWSLSSYIVYEGDTVNLFGIAEYNQIRKIWEITKPIAIMKDGFEKFISHLSKEQFYFLCGTIFRGILLYYIVKGGMLVLKSLVGRIIQGVKKIFN